MNGVNLREPTSFLDHVYLGCTQRQCEISKDIVDSYRTMFEFIISAGATEKLQCSENLPAIWKVMPRNVWNDAVSWHTGRLKNSTKYPLHALMTIIPKKKKWNLLENCHKYALRLFWNAKTCHVLDDLIFHGQWTNLHDRSQNGPKLVANDYLVWSLTFIIHVNTNSIAMWETLPNNADWDCFEAPILQEILRIQNLHQVEQCAFLEAIHSIQEEGPGTRKRNLLPKTAELGEQPLAHGASSSVAKESHKNTEATWDHYLHWSPDTSHFVEAVFSMVRKIYEKNTWRSYGRFKCEFGYLENVYEYHSSSSSSNRKRLWREFEICKELSLENNGTAFQRNRKADQWSDRNHWHKPDQFPRFNRNLAKLVKIFPGITVRQDLTVQK